MYGNHRSSRLLWAGILCYLDVYTRAGQSAQGRNPRLEGNPLILILWAGILCCATRQVVGRRKGRKDPYLPKCALAVAPPRTANRSC